MHSRAHIHDSREGAVVVNGFDIHDNPGTREKKSTYQDRARRGVREQLGNLLAARGG